MDLRKSPNSADFRTFSLPEPIRLRCGVKHPPHAPRRLPARRRPCPERWQPCAEAPRTKRPAPGAARARGPRPAAPGLPAGCRSGAAWCCDPAGRVQPSRRSRRARVGAGARAGATPAAAHPGSGGEASCPFTVGDALRRQGSATGTSTTVTSSGGTKRKREASGVGSARTSSKTTRVTLPMRSWTAVSRMAPLPASTVSCSFS